MTVLDLFRLENRIAVVTGGAQGIGFEIVRALQEAGAQVIIADRNCDIGQAAAETLGVTFEKLDVTDPGSVADLARRIHTQHGRIDVLVNNAGIVYNLPAEETPDQEWMRVQDVNVNGVFWCCREFGKVMLAAQKGSIVNTASMSGLISNHPQPQAGYNASKAAVINLTRSLAGEWATRGVRVNAVAPGYTATALTQKAVEIPEWYDVWLKETPMGRMAEPREIAPAVLYLASDAASFVTGHALVVDGGYTAW